MKIGDKVQVIDPMKCDLENGIMKGCLGQVVNILGNEVYPNICINVNMNGYQVKFFRWQVEVVFNENIN